MPNYLTNCLTNYLTFHELIFIPITIGAKGTFVTFLGYFSSFVDEFWWHIYDKRKKNTLFKYCKKCKKYYYIHKSTTSLEWEKTNYCIFVQIINLHHLQFLTLFFAIWTIEILNCSSWKRKPYKLTSN